MKRATLLLLATVAAVSACSPDSAGLLTPSGDTSRDSGIVGSVGGKSEDTGYVGPGGGKEDTGGGTVESGT